jgi:hypothetical protein
MFLVAGACAATLGSATSSSNNTASQPSQYGQDNPPPPQQMDPQRALGLWKSTFGDVKIEADQNGGGPQTGAVQGVWLYQRQRQDVIGYFHGSLNGNVLRFRWDEPGTQGSPPLSGEGYLVFDPAGRQYSGRWWSNQHDRSGDWNGWRLANRPQPGGYGQPQPGYGQP